MSDNFICRTETFNDRHPCFVDERNECIAVKTTECGLDLDEIPENEETRELFEAARKTGLSTILSDADAMEYVKRRVPYPADIDHFSPATQSYGEMYQNSLRQEADRFMANARSIIQRRMRQTDRHFGPLC